MKRTTIISALAPLFVLGAAACGGSSSPAPATAAGGTDGASAASLIIQHQTRGCHAWSLNGLPFAARQMARLEHGNGITVTNNDVMPQKLAQTSGAPVKIAGAAMNHPGAQATLVFPLAGRYTFTTKAGEDYTSGIETIGPDNTLRLTVVVA
jgi:hypothetical protein